MGGTAYRRSNRNGKMYSLASGEDCEMESYYGPEAGEVSVGVEKTLGRLFNVLGETIDKGKH